MSESANSPVNSNDSAAGCGCLLILIALVAVPIIGYNALNDGGWIAHTKSVDMYMSGDWLVGENRDCIGFQSKPTYSAAVITSIECPIGSHSENPHNLEVKFFGKISRPDLFSSTDKNFEWRCKREESGFTCYALN
jgi:hypothetical protein